MLSKEVKVLTDKLIATYLAVGVQPSDIADTVFEDNYIEMSLSKKNKQLIMTFTFEEFDEEGQQILNSMRYTYSEAKQLNRVEQKVGKGRFKVQWDRYDDLMSILSELLSLVPSKAARESLIETLPQDLKAFTISSIAA
ncbi:TPA: hypothetical protein ACN33E_004250 [Vibrio parahaemolyticus]|uniref:hypothetical protein n=1 Tax=Vibrio parahaemolyticus TaxID=670 RepID=UPI0010E02464|nr:hypothetical protein [Vibrio parahaemolyticus]EHZ2646394.1 hypothetical protein [Vibrio parahaemolyticus]EIA3186282.1 hypothetical protein [Vibrio parahaemolyticus]ELM4066242.1 hypothetical protein [Vibrio parahaemolyticus]MBE3871257.1 hypothetical protein [Vibrio parahaemolyticus]MDF5014255.1 hypothetical protein [Vibrio parahaemolyticus]